ncbi:MAG: hypothetical protein AB8B69_00510 [Chitinophagales bacterium]
MINFKPFCKLFFISIFLFVGCAGEAERLQKKIPANLSGIEVEKEVKDFLHDLKQNEVVICKRANCLSEKLKSQIFEYEKKSEANSFPKSSFDNTYTFYYSDWNRSCIVGENEPSALINFVLITDKHIGLSFKHGGFAISKLFKVFVIEDGHLSNHWIRSMESSSLRDLTYELLEGEFKVVK